MFDSSSKTSFCIVCGGTFEDVCILDLENLSEDEAQLWKQGYGYDRSILPETDWLHSLRVVGSYSDPELENYSEDPHIFISGPTLREPANHFDKYVWLPLRNSSRNHRWLKVFKHLDEQRSQVLLPIHHNCLTLLESFIDNRKQRSPSHPLASLGSFVDAFVARFNLCISIAASVSQVDKPTTYFRDGGCEWSHGYFGARSLWCESWPPVSGSEWYCADPVAVADLEKFSAHYQQPLVTLDSSDVDFSSLHAPNKLESLPSEILSMISELLPLRSILNFRAVSPHVREKLPPLDSIFWRRQCLRLYSDCVPELCDDTKFPPRMLWKYILQDFTGARRAILSSHLGVTPQTLDRLRPDARQICRAAKHPAKTLPLGLINRLRIWLILESVSVNCEQETRID